jgi:hypothetical protein
MAVSIRALGEILEVVYSSGDVTREDLAEQRALVADAISKRALRKVLIDASALKSMPSVVTILDHNSAVSADSTLRKVKFAVVCGSFGIDERFLETTGFNRGVQVRCFTSRDSALSWLDG